MIYSFLWLIMHHYSRHHPIFWIYTAFYDTLHLLVLSYLNSIISILNHQYQQPYVLYKNKTFVQTRTSFDAYIPQIEAELTLNYCTDYNTFYYLSQQSHYISHLSDHSFQMFNFPIKPYQYCHQYCFHQLTENQWLKCFWCWLICQLWKRRVKWVKNVIEKNQYVC